MGYFDLFKRFLARIQRASVRFNDNLASGQVLAESPLFHASKAVEIKKALVQTPAAFTADASNYKTIVLKNKGTDGAGTAVIADFDIGDDENLVAFDIVDLGTLANNRIAAGGAVSIEVTETGTGTRPDLTGMVVVLEYAITEL